MLFVTSVEPAECFRRLAAALAATSAAASAGLAVREPSVPAGLGCH